MKDEVSGHKTLIIDDESEVADLVKLILTRGRHDDVKIAANAHEGLIVAKQELPDLIIVRIMMHEMSGYEVCRRLKTMPELQNVPILLQDAIDPKWVYPEAQRVGAAGYLLQPFHPQEVIAAHDAVLCGGLYYPPLPEENKSQ